jgi:ABC-type polysaccharide/polyol phosphate transport system ATPase subunit
MVPLLEVGIGFNPELSGLENIFLTGAIMGFSRRQMAARVQPILEFAELSEFADSPIKYYSSGMAQRLAFSIATEIDPAILLLDEIFSAGDIHWMDRAQRRMRSLIDRTSILILVSHQMELIQQYCNSAIWMQAGQIVMQDLPEKVIAAYQASAARRPGGSGG